MRLQKKIGISPPVVERHISKLKAEGILFLEEADNGGSWGILFAEDKSTKKLIFSLIIFTFPNFFVNMTKI
jgi:hypothetical protein